MMDPPVIAGSRSVGGQTVQRVSGPSFVEVLEALDSRAPEAGDADGPIDRVLVPRPIPEILAEIASTWQLHPVLVEDLFHGGQRSKLERYGEVLFVVLKSAVYLDAEEEVEFSEVHLLIRGNTVVTICQDERFLDGRTIPSSAEELLTTVDTAPALDAHGVSADTVELMSMGSQALVYRLLDLTVDGYAPVLDGLLDDKEQIERQVFSGDAAAAERIYRLSQEVIDVLHAATALGKLARALNDGSAKYHIPAELQTYLTDVEDHLTRILTESTELRDSLSQILGVNSTLVAQRQNDDMKKISGWAAILFAPTLIGAIYGMNFDDMPELHWALGYPMALGLMLALGITLYIVFKMKKWM